MKKFFLILTAITIALKSFAWQPDTSRLNLNILALDMPYQNHVEEIYSPWQMPFSPSMQQSLAITTSVYNLTFAAIDNIRLDDKPPLINALVQSSAYYLALITLAYAPFGDSWLHEEFHRSVLTFRGVQSFDMVYTFPLFAETISVNRVADSDLVRMKALYPQDFVRLPEAGIEGEYLLITNLQKLSFFDHQPYPYYVQEAITTTNSILYVWMCHTQEAEKLTEEFNAEESTISERDFTGLDFTAWVYDLFRPDEPFTARGIHPSGTGIDRYIKPSDLSPDEMAYLKRSAYWQLTNLVSPFLFGINRIHMGKIDYNFAFRHFLTSFGWDLAIYNFIQKQNLKLLITPHLFSNYYRFFPGLEGEIQDISLLNNRALITPRLMLFLQPDNLDFYSHLSRPGLFLGINTSVRLNKHFYLQADFDLKTAGWVPGIVNQNKGFDFRLGIRYRK